MTKSLKPRNEYIDVVRAFAIICAVVGHCVQYGSGYNYLTKNLFFDNALFKIIYSFHMPLFMLISGYLLNFSINNDWKTLISSKIKSILIPILSWAFISLCLRIIRMIFHRDSITIGTIIRNYFVILRSNLWFLWAILLCSVIIILAHRFFSDSIIFYSLLIVLSFFTTDKYNFDLYKYMFPFFLTGYFFNKYNVIEKIKKYIGFRSLTILGLLFAVLLMFYNYDSYICTSGYCIMKGNPIRQLTIDLYRFVIGLIGCCFFLLLIYLTYRHFHSMTKWIVIVGQNTIGIYIISNYINNHLLNTITSEMTNINYIFTIIESFIVLCCSLFITLIIKKISILNKFLLGNR